MSVKCIHLFALQAFDASAALHTSSTDEVVKGPSTLATLFNHMWPRIVADPSTLGRHVCYVCKRSVCGGDEPQPVAHLSHKLQCARQSLKIMVSYGNKYPRHNARPHVVEQSSQCARALRRTGQVGRRGRIFPTIQLMGITHAQSGGGNVGKFTFLVKKKKKVVKI